MSNSTETLARQRICSLLDEKSFMEIGSMVTARSTDFCLTHTDTPSDGVITGYGLINGNLVYVYSQDVSVLNGTIGEMEEVLMYLFFLQAIQGHKAADGLFVHG